MIVSPNKGLFFLGTALMCSASLYGAELTSPHNDPLTRIFVGQPNQLTLPPEFSDGTEVSPDQEDRCAPQVADGLASVTLQKASALSDAACPPDDKPASGAIVLPGAVSALAPHAEAKIEQASASGAVQSH